MVVQQGFNPTFTVIFKLKLLQAKSSYFVQDIVAHLRKESHAQVYSSAMSPPVARQILASTEAIMGVDGSGEGQRRIRQLKENTRLVEIYHS